MTNRLVVRILVCFIGFIIGVLVEFKAHAGFFRPDKTVVKCNFRMNDMSLYIEGELIEHSGDKWMVDFTDELKKYPTEDVAPYVKTVNGNQCILVEGKLPFDKEYYR